MSSPRDLLRPPVTLLAGTLGHTWLSRQILSLSEFDFSAILVLEQPTLIADLTSKLHEFDEGFLDAYDPASFVELPALAGIPDDLRTRLRAALRSAYLTQFHPAARLHDLRTRTGAFLSAFDAWHSVVSPAGPTPASRPLWLELRRTAESLRELLESPELQRRWIP